MKLIPGTVSLQVVIEIPTSTWDKVYSRYEAKGYTRQSEYAKRWETALGNLSGVTETCISHLCWLRAEVSAKTYEGVPAEIERLRAKIDRVNARYIGK